MEQKRQRLYVDPEIQFPLILSLILLVTAQGVFVGWGFSKALAIAKQWQRPEQAAQFFAVLLATVVPVVIVNFLAGTWLSHKFAGPLVQIRAVLGEVARGNLEVEVRLRSGDFLNSHAYEINRVIQTLRKLLYRDYGFVRDADDILSRCRKTVGKGPLNEGARRELEELLNDAKSRLSVVNSHFLKGKIDEHD